MRLNWEHKIYEKDFSTREIYLNEINRILENINVDYNKVKNKLNTSELYDMNSEVVDKIIDYSEEVVEEYKMLIYKIEELKGDIR